MERVVRRAYIDTFKLFRFGGRCATALGPSNPGAYRLAPTADLRIFHAGAGVWETIASDDTHDTSRPAARWGASFTRDARTAVLFGGTTDDGSAGTIFDDVHLLDTVSQKWTVPDVTDNGGPSPAPRFGHVAVSVETPHVRAHSSRTLIFGGETRDGVLLNDVALLEVVVDDNPDSARVKWSKPILDTPDGTPIGRVNSTGATTYGVHPKALKPISGEVQPSDTITARWTVFMFGGRVDASGEHANIGFGYKRGSLGLMNDLWALRPVGCGDDGGLDTLRWERVLPAGRPPARREVRMHATAPTDACIT
jgi:hypothetical protein